jgi:phospholipid N-methyltransferase
MGPKNAKIKKTPFFREFLRDRNVAAVSPSSPHLMKRLAKNLDLPAIRRIVELGPGEGVAVRALLPKLSEEARYVAIERNPNFVSRLKKTKDHRFTVIQGRAQDLRRIVAHADGKVDAVIASIPFTYLKKDERTALVTEAKRLLRPGGTFIVFHQYSPLMVPYLAKEFPDVHVEFEPLNILPCFLMRVRK